MAECQYCGIKALELKDVSGRKMNSDLLPLPLISATPKNHLLVILESYTDQAAINYLYNNKTFTPGL